MTVSEERRPARRSGRGERWVTALDRRLPVASAGKEFLREAFPDHWSFLAALVFVAAIGVHLLRIPGYLEGAPRLMPGRETDVAGHTIVWDVLLPGAVLPAVLFLVLYGYPFFERRLTGPRPEQHLCDRPRNQPTRTALGAAAVSAYGVLLLAGGQDVLAYRFSLDVELPARMFRTALFVLPFVTYHITKRACLGLQAADRRRILEGGVTGEVRRTAGGGYEEAHTLLSREEAYRILVRDTPGPRAEGTEAWRWFHRHRLRNALSRWYFAKSAEMPATAWEKRRVEVVRAAPGEVPGQRHES
ncbi:hypothetical protein ACWC4C_21975 [Streptomyces olivaceoviridis]